MQFILFIRALFSGKISILTIIAILTFGISIYLLWTHQHLTISSILSNIGISFLAASLVTAVEATKGNKALYLIKLFSINSFKKIAIVVPQFTKGEIILDATTNPPKKVLLSEIPSMSKTDLLTANSFVALFQKHNIDLPEIITDEQAISIIADEKSIKLYKTFISIGLNSNQFSMAIAEKYLNRNIVNFDNSSFPYPGEKMIKFNDGGSTLADYNLKDLKWCDIILLLKVACKNNSLNEKYNVTICGGLNATGTKILGSYIYSDWYNEICSLKINKKPLLDCKNYAILYKVNGKLNTRLDTDAVIVSHPICIREFETI